MRHNSDAIRQVLVVDDDREMRDLLSEVASYIGCRPLKARSAQKALSIIEAEQVHLMLLDLYMPGGNGADLLGTLRKRHLDVPTLVVSGYVSSPVLRQLVGLGVRGIVAKPFSVDRLMDEMARWLGMDGRTRDPVPTCRFCGCDVGGNHKFCSHCGQPLKASRLARPERVAA